MSNSKKSANTFQVELTDTVVNCVKEVLSHRRGGDFNSLLSELIEQSANNLLYRYNRNKVQWEKAKLSRQNEISLQERIKELEAKMAEKGNS